MKVSIVILEVLKLVAPKDGKNLVLQSPLGRQSPHEQECHFWTLWKQELGFYSVKPLRFWDLSAIPANFTLTNTLMYICFLQFFYITCPFLQYMYVWLYWSTEIQLYPLFLPWHFQFFFWNTSEILQCFIHTLLYMCHVLLVLPIFVTFLNLKTLTCIQLHGTNLILLICFPRSIQHRALHWADT